MSKWKLSEHGRLLTGQLHELRVLKRWSGPSTREDAIQALLQQLADSGETAAIPCVAQFLLATDEQTRATARRITSQLLAGLSPYDLIQLSDCFARQYDWYISEEWEKISPFDLPLLTGSSVESRCPAALGLLSFHRNGYIRHQAVRLLSEQADGTELPFLLLRQNDWVPPIALDAQAAVAQRIGKSYVHHLAGSLRLILHLGTFRRHDHQDVIRKVIELLTWPEHEDILKAAVRNSDREVRRQVVRLGLEIMGDHRERLTSLALESDDSLIRLNACKYVAAAYSDTQLLAILDGLLNDTFMPVRREALRIKTEHFPDLADKTWREALLDSSRSIRELARYSLAQCGLTAQNIAAIYRGVLSEQLDCLPAVEGLAETGDSTDVAYFQELSQHHLPSRRMFAFRGLSRIAKEAALPAFVAFLANDSPGVVREAKKAIEPHSHLLQGDELLSVALGASSAVARKSAVLLLADLGKWRGIDWLLRVAIDVDEQTSVLAQLMITQWLTPPKCNTVFTRPTETQRESIRKSLSRPEARISNAIVALIESELA